MLTIRHIITVPISQSPSDSHVNEESMVFTPATWLPPLPAIPDVPLHKFMFEEKYGRASFNSSLPPFVCSVTGRSISARDLVQRVELLARSLAAELGWSVNEGSEYDKVISVFAMNTVRRLG